MKKNKAAIVGFAFVVAISTITVIVTDFSFNSQTVETDQKFVGLFLDIHFPNSMDEFVHVLSDVDRFLMTFFAGVRHDIGLSLFILAN